MKLIQEIDHYIETVYPEGLTKEQFHTILLAFVSGGILLSLKPELKEQYYSVATLLKEMSDAKNKSYNE